MSIGNVGFVEVPDDGTGETRIGIENVAAVKSAASLLRIPPAAFTKSLTMDRVTLQGEVRVTHTGVRMPRAESLVLKPVWCEIDRGGIQVRRRCSG